MIIAGKSIPIMLAALLWLLAIPANAAELLMFYSPSCSWCERWDQEIGDIYHKTPEAKVLPLRRINVHDPLPDDLKDIPATIYTPTFVAVANGQELGRINGYPGEDFFWYLLEDLINKAKRVSLQSTPDGSH